MSAPAVSALVAAPVCVVLVAAAAAGGARATGAPGCRPTGAHVLAADRAAQVFSWHGSVYGCANPAGVQRLLGGAGFCNSPAGTVAPVKLAGEIVAFGLTHCGVDTGSGSLVERDLASGRTRANLPSITRPIGPESYTSVKTIVLRPDGAVGWIAGGGSIVSHRSSYEVQRLADGKATLLDSGSSIVPSSLRLQGPLMLWRDGQRMRSATLR